MSSLHIVDMFANRYFSVYVGLTENWILVSSVTVFQMSANVDEHNALSVDIPKMAPSVSDCMNTYLQEGWMDEDDLV